MNEPFELIAFGVSALATTNLAINDQIKTTKFFIIQCLTTMSNNNYHFLRPDINNFVIAL